MLVLIQHKRCLRDARGEHGLASGRGYTDRHADVAELVDAHGSGPCARKGVEVQVLSSA